jgi:hypothetical protein
VNSSIYAGHTLVMAKRDFTPDVAKSGNLAYLRIQKMDTDHGLQWPSDKIPGRKSQIAGGCWFLLFLTSPYLIAKLQFWDADASKLVPTIQISDDLVGARNIPVRLVAETPTFARRAALQIPPRLGKLSGNCASRVGELPQRLAELARALCSGKTLTA